MFHTIIDGIIESDIFETIRTVSRPVIPSPKKIYLEKEIPGRAKLIEDLEEYEDIEIDVNFNFIDNYNITLNKLKKAIYKAKKLTFTDMYNKYFVIKKVEFTDEERNVLEIGRCTVKFTVDPYQYFLEGEDEILESEGEISSSTILNKFELAYPIINLYGEGRIRINMNGNFAEINISGKTSIDTNKYIEACFREDGEIYNLTKGKYSELVLKEGRNRISIEALSGTLNSCGIIPNWRTI